MHQTMPHLAGRVALVAGATRGAGRGIAIELGAAVAILLAFAEFVGSQRKELKDFGIFDSLAVGFAQVLALIPGASRSGSNTACAALDTAFCPPLELAVVCTECQRTVCAASKSKVF